MGKVAKNTSRCVILAGGDIVDYPAVASKIGAGDFVICADSGYSHCGPLGVSPDLLVGDFDSIRKAAPSDIPKITLPVDKNYTDTALAAQEAQKQGAKHLLLTGVLGGKRLDHTLANLQLLAHCVKIGMDAEMTDGVTHLYAVTTEDGPASIKLAPLEGYYFSVFALGEPCRKVNIYGGKYPLRDYPLSFDDARAVSNEFVGTTVEITLEQGSLIIVCTPR